MCIIGNGAAAVEAIKALRQNNYSGEINLISNSIWPSYNPMLTTYYVSGKIEFGDMFPFGYDMDFYNKHDVKLHLGSPVVELDADKKIVRTDNGLKLEYDKCLIATGASPFLPRIKGINLKNVYAMRTVEDALKLKDALKKSPKKAIVVGASMVGIKVVELLNNAGLKVTLADQAACMFPLAAHEECAEIIQRILIDKGVDLKFGAAIEGITENGNKLTASFGEAGEVEADIIVICIGVRPNLSFVNKNQITVDRGIVVDDHIVTNNNDVYAAGDVSQGTNILTGEKQIIGLWSNARYQGRTAGRNMAGVEDTFRGSIPHNITHFMDMIFTGMGDLHNGDRHETRQTEDSYVHLVWDKEKLVGVNMLGSSSSNIGIIKSALEKRLINASSLDSGCICSNNLSNNLLINYFNKNK